MAWSVFPIIDFSCPQTRASPRRTASRNSSTESAPGRSDDPPELGEQVRVGPAREGERMLACERDRLFVLGTGHAAADPLEPVELEQDVGRELAGCDRLADSAAEEEVAEGVGGDRKGVPSLQAGEHLRGRERGCHVGAAAEGAGDHRVVVVDEVVEGVEVEEQVRSLRGRDLDPGHDELIRRGLAECSDRARDRVVVRDRERGPDPAPAPERVSDPYQAVRVLGMDVHVDSGVAVFPEGGEVRRPEPDPGRPPASPSMSVAWGVRRINPSPVGPGALASAGRIAPSGIG